LSGVVSMPSASTVSPYSVAARLLATAATVMSVPAATSAAAPAVSYATTGSIRCARR